ncbi:TraB/GumN family protein [Aestuariibacter sp. GS-14]|uniref:TraB/GumN family protein n=1 Tax=Aestuariibacter sp. GS-14 TaxID=2590670 RepID=UPI00112CCBC7|nr:TraB/GumN family protein [Aestuariibacter sp. GS-14]TPV60689.1 TraB/GumN family protein [Aestuariibacter sp. GS-14]
MRFLLLSSFLLFTFTGHAASVWKVTNGDNTVYIGGTLHLLSPDDFPLPDAYAQAYNAATKLVFETDIAGLNSPAFQQDTLKHLTYQDGTRLNDVLSNDTYKALADHLSSRHLSIDNFAHYTPALISVTLSVVELRNLGLTSQGVDEFYYFQAMMDNKQLDWFESPQQQLAFIKSLGDGDDDQIIRYALEDVLQIKDSIGELKDYWRSGNMAGMEQSSMQEFEASFPKVFNTLLTQRNQNWLPMLTGMLSTPETEFVLVGTMHLAGAKSVLSLLEKRGYSVQQLN